MENSIEIEAIWAAGKQANGCLLCFQEVNLFDLDKEIEGKIIVISGPLDQGVWYKAISLGVVGLVIANPPEKELTSEIEKEGLGILVLGDEKMKEVWEALNKNKDKEVRLNPKEKKILI